MLCFLVTSILRFALLPYYRRYVIHRNFHHINILFLGESFSQSLKHVSIQIIENRDLFALQIRLFHTCCNHYKIKGFMVFLGGKKIEHWPEKS